MKGLAVILSSLGTSLRKRNGRVVWWLVLGITVLVVIYSSIFHMIMDYEGRSYSWATGIYWTLTVMSTLGFGDITFESDLGRIFSVVVLISGALLILVLLPFVFIQFVFLPWMAARDANRIRRHLGDEYHDHVILTHLDPVTESLIRRLKNLGIPSVLIVDETTQAISLSELGYDVLVGPVDDPATYAAARADHAALVVATLSDMTNANIVFTASEFSPGVPTVALASSETARDVLAHAGCDHVLRLGLLLGQAMARRVLGNDARSRAIGVFGDLIVAEAAVAGTTFENRTIAQTELRDQCNVTIIGLWRRGTFTLAEATTIIESSDVMVLVGSASQLDRYDALFGVEVHQDASVIVVGGGRVGRAATQALRNEGIDCTIIELQESRIRNPAFYVQGDASNLDVLERAGFASASAILITTHDDDFNVYLTIYLRQLAPEKQIIARANLERNVATLHRAGADSVLSYATQGATEILNALGGSDHVVLAEGLEMFSIPVPETLSGMTLAAARIPEEIGCRIVAISKGDHSVPNPDPLAPIPGDASLVVVGNSASEKRFLDRYRPNPAERARHRQRRRQSGIRGPNPLA